MNSDLQVVSRSVVLALLVALSGCIEITKSYPEKQFYAFETARQGAKSSLVPGTILRVRPFPAAPKFEGRELVYRTGEFQYESDFYNEWLVAPNAILTQQVQNWLAASGLFQYVLDGSSMLDETHVLEGSITALYGDYRDKTSPKAVMELRVRLIHESGNHSDIVLQQDYRQAVTVADESPGTLVKGWNDELQQILTALEEDLRRTDILAKTRK
jgi:uncharacterized lipoprotein YmbA